jgi:hypothetical protein
MIMSGEIAHKLSAFRVPRNHTGSRIAMGIRCLRRPNWRCWSSGRRAKGAVHRTPGPRRWSEPGVVREFQGLVPHRRWPAHRFADHLGCLQPVSAALPRGVEKTDTPRTRATFEAAVANTACRRRSAPTTVLQSPRMPCGGCCGWRGVMDEAGHRRGVDRGQAIRSRTGGISACTAR